MPVAAWSQLAVTVLIGMAGLYLVHNYRRHTRVMLAEVRRAAYAQLWEVTGLAAPTRLDQAGVGGVLTADERRLLYQRLTDWYYRDGNGMLLEATTRTVYLDAKHNLVCATAALRPAGLLDLLPDTLTEDQRRGCLSIRQLSLLRTQLKADLAIYGSPFVGELTAHEKAFLRHCNVRMWRQPWRKAARGSLKPETCGT